MGKKTDLSVLEPGADVLTSYVELEKKAQGAMLNYFNEPKASNLTSAKAALGMLAIIKGNRASFSAQRVVAYQIVRDISKDRNELKKYIEATQPQLKIIK